MLKVGVIGATGYTGEEIVKILAKHKNVKLTSLQAVIEKEAAISDIFPSLAGKIDLICEKPDIKRAIQKIDLAFLALPHRVSMTLAAEFLNSGKKVIDLSADYRLSPDEYEKWYGVSHRDKENIEKAVYGLPELFEDEIKEACLIANPGCYPTSAVLAVAPLLKNELVDLGSIIIDSKSGATGAGRKADIALSFSEVNENTRAYKINEHQHKPEIENILSRLAGKKVDVVFVPHLLPLNRGILTTVYIDLKVFKGMADILAIYKDFYKKKSFIHVMNEGVFPALRDVQFTNACNLGIKIAGKKVIVVSAIDNLLKGAAGQAVQNMNLLYGFEETEGLI